MPFVFFCSAHFFEDILTDLKLKAYSGDVQRIERALEDKCDWDFAHTLSEKLPKYAKTEDLYILHDSLKNFKENIVNNLFI